ncbi:hypothetical protein DL240_14495 [Lujinxingia litoralis]|uniref:HdeD family acid-resistance protein n=1 Tax=Lujinxingia litoralis TaxID=2211119 RepID=A0A328C4T8_9DELT|nr:DUF308 domain-containing protein [Lujinxingia litoralis]RAL20890.1 hypothetical protein DL240_14495 [Lujinxingia litoralis]
MATTIQERVAYENWGWMLARGVSALLFGLLFLVWPGPTLAVLVLLLATLLLVDGIIALVYAISGGRTARGKAWPLIGVGVAGISAAVITYVWPQMTLGILMVILAIWAMIRGALEVVAYLELRETFQGSWLLGLSGVLTFFFGIALIVWPAVGLRLLVWIVAGYALLAGGVFLGLAWQMNRALHGGQRDLDTSPPDRPGDFTPT